MPSHPIPDQDPETGLYDIGNTVTARSIGFLGPVLITPAVWQVCIFRDGTDPSWSERLNELLTSLRSDFNKAPDEARDFVFTPPFGHHWQPLKAKLHLGNNGKPEMLVQLFTEASREWPHVKNS